MTKTEKKELENIDKQLREAYNCLIGGSWGEALQILKPALEDLTVLLIEKGQKPLE